MSDKIDKFKLPFVEFIFHLLTQKHFAGRGREKRMQLCYGIVPVNQDLPERGGYATLSRGLNQLLKDFEKFFFVGWLCNIYEKSDVFVMIFHNCVVFA